MQDEQPYYETEQPSTSCMPRRGNVNGPREVQVWKEAGVLGLAEKKLDANGRPTQYVRSVRLAVEQLAESQIAIDLIDGFLGAARAHRERLLKRYSGNVPG